MILLAAFSIGYAAPERLSHPQPLQQLDVGIAIAAVASVINWVTAVVKRLPGTQNVSDGFQNPSRCPAFRWHRLAAGSCVAYPVVER